MNDVFKEQLVVVKQNNMTKIKKTGVIVIAVILGILGLVLGGTFFGPVVIIAAFIGASYLVKGMNLEYEYILTNNELDVDKIMNKERRKRCFTVDIKEINIMARVDDQMRKAEIDRAQKTIDVGTGEIGPDTYAIVFMHKNELTKMIFDPNDELKKLIYRQAPSKVYL